MGVREEPRESLEATLAGFVARRHMLLILDNCEHILAPCADLVCGLLVACPRLHVLATSCEPLGVQGETLYPVAPLSVRPPRPSVEDLQRYESAGLFLARARTCRPGFSATPANSTAIARVCRQLDGIPLALELAAARVATLPVEVLAERLHDCLRLLTGGPRTALPREAHAACHA